MHETRRQFGILHWQIKIVTLTLRTAPDFSKNLDGAYSDADEVEGFDEDFTLSLSNLPAIGCIYIEDSNLICDCNDNALAGIYTTTVIV